MPIRARKDGAAFHGCVPQYPDLAAVRFPVAFEDLDGGGFTGTVGTQEGVRFAGMDGEIQLVHRRERTAFGQGRTSW